MSAPSPPEAGASPWRFFVWLFAVSLPFWILGPAGERALGLDLPVKLPLSAAMVVCPAAVAMALTARAGGGPGVRKLLGRAFQLRGFGWPWRIAAAAIPPLTALATYGLLRLTGTALPPSTPILAAVPMLAVFFVAALAEELGWQAYAADPLRARFGGLGAGLILGLAWAIWHLPGYWALHPQAGWVIWQCIYSVAARVVMVRLYERAGLSVLATVLFHTMINVSVFMFPTFGSAYNPVITGLLTAALALATTPGWRRRAPAAPA